MATLAISPSVRRAYGLDQPDTVSARSQSNRRVKQPREVTKRAILDVLYRVGRPLTRLDIADELGMKKTPWLITLIEELRDQGVIVRSAYTLPHGVICYLYQPAE
jgi:hypothetical protein